MFWQKAAVDCKENELYTDEVKTDQRKNMKATSFRQGIKKAPDILAESGASRRRLPTLPLAQYHRRDEA